MDGLWYTLAILLQLTAGAAAPIAVENERGLVLVNFSWGRFQQNPNGLKSPFPNEPTDLGIKGRRGAYSRRVERRPVRGFAYRMKLKNEGAKTITALFWEYQFGDPAAPRDVSRRQFGCREKMKRGETKELAVFSASPPTLTVSAESAGGGTESVFATKVVINRVEYADGTVWRRTGWSPPRTSAYPADLFPDPRYRGKCIGF